MRFAVKPQEAIAFEATQGQEIKIIDTKGQQVADLVAFNLFDFSEHLSTKVSIDNNKSIFLYQNQALFSNKYQELLKLKYSSVPKHDLIFPACSQEMFKSEYRITRHPNCHDNLLGVLRKIEYLPAPANLFMNTQVDSNGGIAVLRPLSQPGDYVILEAKKDLLIGLAACPVSQSKCNGYKCTGLEVILP